MANEISYSVMLQISKYGATVSQSLSRAKDMANDQFINNVQIIGTNVEAVVLGDINLPGLIMLKNMDATNYIDLCIDSGGTGVFTQLLAGDTCFVHPPAPIYARAKNQACNLLVTGGED